MRDPILPFLYLTRVSLYLLFTFPPFSLFPLLSLYLPLPSLSVLYPPLTLIPSFFTFSLPSFTFLYSLYLPFTFFTFLYLPLPSFTFLNCPDISPKPL